MIDFKLTQNGDIDIANAYQYPYFIIQYNIPAAGAEDNTRRYPSFCINFDTDVKQYELQGNRFLIQFRTKKRIVPYKAISIKPVTDKEELAQEITIRLKTERGEFQYIKELGSQFVTLRHSDIKSETTKELAEQYTSDAIGDVTFEQDFEINAVWEDDDSRYKHERLKITIDTERDTIYEAAI